MIKTQIKIKEVEQKAPIYVPTVCVKINQSSFVELIV